MKVSARALALLVAVSATVCAQDSAAVPEPETAKITTQQLDSYKAEVEGIPDIQCTDISAHQRQCSSKARATTWTFTLPGHPAHPAVSRGTVLQATQGARVGFHRSGHYAGDAAAYEAWVKDFHVVDQRQVTQAQSMLNPT